MTNVIRLDDKSKRKSLPKLLIEFQSHCAAYIALEAQYQSELKVACATARKRDSTRLRAARTLVQMREAVLAGEAGEGIKWWAWFTANVPGISRKDCEKLLRIGYSKNPEEAAAGERERNRAHKAAQRARERDAVVAALLIDREAEEAVLVPADSSNVSGTCTDNDAPPPLTVKSSTSP